MSTDSQSRKVRSIEADRDRLLEDAAGSLGVVEIMRLYDSAEAAYTAASSSSGVQVASSTNLTVHTVNAELG